MRRNAPMAGIKAPTAPVRGVEDFTKALRSVPDQLPAGLRDGMVYKTKDAKGNVTYSGRNVTGDVSDRMLNGDGTSAGPMRGSLRVASGAPTFGPNGSYVIDDQAPTGKAKQAQINATLRNPDGSTWSARDNAVMAANLRDGVDPYRGTSRAAPEEERIPAIGEFGHNRAVAAKAERERNKTMLRGQDLDYGSKQAQNKVAMLSAQRDQYNKDREFGLSKEAHDQAIGDKAREGTAKEFTVYDTDKDGRQVANPAASAASLDALRSILPGMTSTDPKTREAALSDAKAMHGIFLRARSQDPVGWEAMKFWQPKRPALSGMPDATNGSVRQLSGLDGVMTLKAQNGDTLLRQEDGREINLGPLDSRQRKLLEDAQQRGWGK